MTVEDILKLGAMGYTKEEIEAMNNTKEEPEREPEQEPEKEQEKAPEKTQEPEQRPDPTQDMLKFIAGEFEKLNRSIQEANINGSDIQQPKEQTAEEVLADIIAPPRKKGGK